MIESSSTTKKRFIKAIVILLLAVVLVMTFIFFCFFISEYWFRLIEYAPKDFLPDLEKEAGVKLPSDITDVKTAKAFLREDTVIFIIKFVAKPEVVDEFIKSLPLSTGMGSESYDREHDTRNRFGYWRPPKWFREEISHGKMVLYHADYTALGMRIYVDTSDEKSFVVYIEGVYHQRP